ncbi:hypothetical protein P152DRAFT_327653 [Eremomyces bilateralis CBS 781.70]|uniref:Uncharacterized protein n=1 Tax=Eremomyces bilateralis CBS 781.70 TaxID=1392243 RepID=A0A6G1G491_9PEZI|nr:uncharacterized protein P152DRAFT_327653 [Eremomyces bilateralis CBS 781.70]KAF1812838.1 hypothetical protein P152DRAFT_327653 [Eremomyces bilateralis CBS 781.70]
MMASHLDENEKADRSGDLIEPSIFGITHIYWTTDPCCLSLEIRRGLLIGHACYNRMFDTLAVTRGGFRAARCSSRRGDEMQPRMRSSMRDFVVTTVNSLFLGIVGSLHRSLSTELPVYRKFHAIPHLFDSTSRPLARVGGNDCCCSRAKIQICICGHLLSHADILQGSRGLVMDLTWLDEWTGCS